MKRKITFLTIIIFILVLTINITYSRFSLNKNITGSIKVYSYDYCKENGFTKLSDCILIMENYSSNTNEAKQYIVNKGQANTSSNAPTINYIETKTESTNETNGILYSAAHLTLSKTYTFNPQTGLYTLTNYINSIPKDEYIDYYTCGNTTGTWNVCSKIFQIKAFREEKTDISTAYRITKAVIHNFKEVSSFDSEVGLYATEDDYGTSYFYRGDVKNNYVSFAGFIWRIVRINGDGTIRLVYSGKTPTATGTSATIGNAAYNNKYRDPTYIGYTYNEDFSFQDNKTYLHWNNFSENTSYYFGSTYTYDENKHTFKLNGNLKTSIWKNDYSDLIKNYPYTCLSTGKDTECSILLRVRGYKDAATMGVDILSYNSKSYEATLINNEESDMKKYLDNWYVTNILNKKTSSGISFANYVADSNFCNDRSLFQGNGYEISSMTKYSPFNRIMNLHKPSLKCPQSTDVFKVSNNNLTYPIALLTSDEINFAGAFYNYVNTKYYLYINKSFWTMSPSQFTNYSALAYIWFVNTTGGLNNHYTSLSNGVRPVINLKNDVTIISGTGTQDNPYILTN